MRMGNKTNIDVCLQGPCPMLSTLDGTSFIKIKQ